MTATTNIPILSAAQVRQSLGLLNGSAHDLLAAVLLPEIERFPTESIDTVVGLRDRLGVIPQHYQLFDALLEILGRHGLVERSAEQLHFAEAGRRAEYIRRGQVVLAAEGGGEVADPVVREANRPNMEVVRSVAARLPAVLRGEVDGVSLLFAGENAARMAEMYRNTVQRYFYDQIGRRILRYCETVWRKDPDRKVHILEGGAGTGVGTEQIMRLLQPHGDRIVFTFTDIGGSFIRKAKRRLGSHLPHTEFRKYDVSAPPTEQGLEAGSYDVAFCSNVIHATPRIDDTLGSLRQLLRPGGLLLLNEICRDLTTNTLTVGTTAGWWLAQDGCRLPHGPLVSPDTLEERCAGLGLEVDRSVGYPGLERAEWPQVLVRAAVPQPEPVRTGRHYLTTTDVAAVLSGERPVSLDDTTRQSLLEGHEFLRQFAAEKVIYGVNTGFGPMAPYKIPDSERVQLQLNLIRSHCSGSGRLVSPAYTKALMVARLNTLSKGYSGIHPELVELLTALVNNDVLPHIYEHGGLGASGDLVQLAHLALCLLGEGKVRYRDQDREAAEVFEELGLTPIRPRIREALAILNGTSAMTGYGAVNVNRSRQLLAWSELSSALLIELVGSYDDYYSPQLNGVKCHAGQQAAAQRLRTLLRGSKRLRRRADHLYQAHDNKRLDDKVQEYYSIRCLPQIMGPIYDTVQEANRVVEDELNSVSDNPIIDHEAGNVYHGGNFHGDYVSLAMDKLKVVTTKLSLLIERQLNYLLNDRLNQQLPPFVNLGTLGLNLGMQGAQFVATSTAAENQTLSAPMYVHTIPSNNDNQDIVSMGSNAALIAGKVIDNTYEVLAVKVLTLVQAVDALDIADELSPATRWLYDRVRERVPRFAEDGIMYERTHAVHRLLCTCAPAPLVTDNQQ